MDGMTPLLCAADRGSMKIMKFLADRGGSLASCDNEGMNALLFACMRGHVEVARWLLESPERAGHVDQRDKYLSTALYLASYSNRPECVELLITRGADLEARNKYGFTPLLRAARSKDALATVKLLFSRGADTAALTPDGSVSVFMMACASGSEPMVRFLKSVCDAEYCGPSGLGPWHVATWMGRANIVQLLEEWGLRGDPDISHALWQCHVKGVCTRTVTGATEAYQTLLRWYPRDADVFVCSYCAANCYKSSSAASDLIFSLGTCRCSFCNGGAGAAP